MGKSAVYTRTGDQGETSLVSGSRLPKSDERIDLYGEVDELNSHLGLLVAHLEASDVKKETKENFFTVSQDIQSALFNLGSFLACEEEYWEKYKLPQISDELIKTIEVQIDELDGKLPALKNFILPGGSVVGAQAHVARTVCRKVERKLVLFNNHGHAFPTNSLILLNRLSDFLFVIARYFNLELNKAETIWKV